MTVSDLQTLRQQAEREISATKNERELNDVEVVYVGRKGKLTGLLRQLKDLSIEQRREIGPVANQIHSAISGAITAARQNFAAASREKIDVTLPGIPPTTGHLHLVTQAIEEISSIFREIGFQRVRHPDVEVDWYPFEALNMPPDHPARDEWETFFMDAPADEKGQRFVLTPHATSGTARALATRQVPLQAINIQKCYRRQSDLTHVPVFHQFDGLYVDTNVTIQHLKGVLEYFVKSYYGPDRTIRLRPFHFQFTEPSFEVDVSCGVCGGTGRVSASQKCRVCKEGWIELGGSGMVHPNVLKAAKLDPKKVSGLAFGWGVERVLFMRSGLEIPDLRMLYDNDLRFLEQF